MPTPFLTDFGLARTTATGSRYTRTGEALGTPAYMSPEQARGETTTLTPAADVWSLGCVLYECLAGRRAFEGETGADVIGRVLTAEPPALRGVRAGVPRELEAVVRLALAKSAGRRYGDAGALHEDLDRCLRGARTLAVRRRARRGFSRAFAAALLLAVAAALVGLAPRGPRSPSDVPVPGPAREMLRQVRALRMREPEEAAARVRLALRDRPEDRALRRELADCLRDAGRWREADLEYTDQLASSPRDPGLSFGRGFTRWLCAQTSAETLGSSRPDLEAACGAPGWEGAIARAIRDWDDDPDGTRQGALERAEDRWEVHLTRGLLLHHGGAPDARDQERAVREFTAALATGPPLAATFCERGHALYILGDFARARDDFDRSVALAPADLVARVNRGNARVRTGDLAGARADYEAVLEREPTNVVARERRGRVRQMLGDLAGAAEDLDRALAETPGVSPELLKTRAQIRLARDDVRGALQDLDQAIGQEPDDPGALLNRGVCRWRLGDVEAAITDLEASAKRRPGAAAVHLNLGVGYFALRRWGEAEAAFTEFLRLAPDDPRAEEIRAELARCRRFLGRE